VTTISVSRLLRFVVCSSHVSPEVAVVVGGWGVGRVET